MGEMMTDKIKVISQTTAEREQETVEFFKEVEPLLQEGYTLREAVWELKHQHGNPRRAWYRDLRNYAEEQGYDCR